MITSEIALLSCINWYRFVRRTYVHGYSKEQGVGK